MGDLSRRGIQRGQDSYPQIWRWWTVLGRVDLPPMRQRRLKAPASFPVAHYHCMSRVVNRDFLFGPQEREQFVRLLREYERFCGVRVLTYCILSNPFHLLVEVPARPAQPLSAEEVLDRIEGLSSSALTPGLFQQRLAQFLAAGDADGERAFLDRICTSMWRMVVLSPRPSFGLAMV